MKIVRRGGRLVLYNAEVFRQEGILSRVMVNPTERPSNRRRMDGALVVAAGIVLLFAVVGVVSAGLFVAGKVSGSSPKAVATATPARTNPLAAQDIHRAQAQATAIVRQAQAAGHSIVAAASARAHRQANAVLSSARRQAATVRVAAPAPAVIPTAVPSSGLVPAPGNTGSVATGAAGNSGSTAASNGASAAGSVRSIGTAGPVPNLRALPSTWLVIGYNATFSNGTGGIGTISVVNRSGKTFGGVATVKYRSGGSASAAFSGLAPGQAVVLPLSGRAYSGGGYQIVMNGLH